MQVSVVILPILRTYLPAKIPGTYALQLQWRSVYVQAMCTLPVHAHKGYVNEYTVGAAERAAQTRVVQIELHVFVFVRSHFVSPPRQHEARHASFTSHEQSDDQQSDSKVDHQELVPIEPHSLSMPPLRRCDTPSSDSFRSEGRLV